MEDKQGAQLYGPFTILDELLECMMRGDKLPINILHIAGSRFCSKTFSVEHMSIKAMLAMRGIGVMAVRNEVGMAEELFTEYREMAADDFGGMFKVNLSKRTLEYGTNKLTVKGVNNGKVDNNGIKKPGLSKYREAKYIIMHNEEAYEIEPKQKRDIKQSLRSNKDTQILEINTLNPASLGNEYIAYLNQHFKFNEKELRANGYQ